MHACENSSFYYLSHHAQREVSLPVLCFSQVWIFSAPTTQPDTFLGLAISCGSGNIMVPLSTLLRRIKLIKLPCLHQRRLLLLWACPAPPCLPLVPRGWKDGMWVRPCKNLSIGLEVFSLHSGSASLDRSSKLANKLLGKVPMNFYTLPWASFPPKACPACHHRLARSKCRHCGGTASMSSLS